MSLMLLLPGLAVYTNQNPLTSLNEDNKLFIITIDGLRWQEVFGGADPLLASDPSCNRDTNKTKAVFWSERKEERRQKLLPFFWQVIARQGCLFGNRDKGSKMNVANPYALSYPGYNELLTGRVDLSLFGNGKASNPNFTLLDDLNASVAYQGRVAAFTSWNAFPFILNEARSSFYINSGFEPPAEKNYRVASRFAAPLSFDAEGNKTTRADELTFSACKEYIQRKKPSIVFLSFSGADEAAHEKKYDQYLQQTHQADRMIGELWQFLQSLPAYAGKTSFLITTDHGRGHNRNNWNTHGVFISGSSQTWMCLLGKGIPASGEQNRHRQLYQKDLKALMYRLLSSR